MRLGRGITLIRTKPHPWTRTSVSIIQKARRLLGMSIIERIGIRMRISMRIGGDITVVISTSHDGRCWVRIIRERIAATVSQLYVGGIFA